LSNIPWQDAIVTPSIDLRFRAAVEAFLRGESSVVEFVFAFRATMNEVVRERPLHGAEGDLFFALEAWEEAGWPDRPSHVERLRVLARQAVDVDDPASER